MNIYKKRIINNFKYKYIYIIFTLNIFLTEKIFNN